MISTGGIKESIPCFIAIMIIQAETQSKIVKDFNERTKHTFLYKNIPLILFLEKGPLFVVV